ncbi:hypothetical protein FHX69_3740 [Prauserella muralis]|nr:hypothetical protein FHX69_3740 [Prauserella muralis]
MGALLGGGAGSVTVPALDRLTDLSRATIHGTSTVTNIAIAIVGVAVYWARGGAIDTSTGLPLMLGGVAGAVLGARLVTRAPERALRILFSAVLLASGTSLLLEAAGITVTAGAGALPEDPAIVVPVALALGTLVGAWSAAMGLGGGLLTVPALVLLFGVDPHTAVGTSLLVMLPNSVAGAAAHLRQGTASVPIGARLAAGAAVGAAGGALLALALDERVLSTILGSYMYFTATRELLRIRRGR